MIAFEIHYAPGESPDERMKAMFAAGSMERPGEYRRLLNERHVNVLTRILKNTVDSLNGLLQDVPNIPKIKFLRYQGQTHWYDSINKLLELIIPQLVDLDSKLPLAKKINQDIIAALQKLKASDNISPTQVMKILAQFEVPGIRQIEFKNDNEEFNLERLLDILYPIELVPTEYNCGVLMTIMSDPCKATPTEAVDRAVVKNTRTNPFTRQPWPASVPTDDRLAKEINLFIKKAEWLFYALNDNQRYITAYHDEVIQGWIQDKNTSYEDFCTQVNLHMSQNTTHFVFFTPETEINVFPAKYILDLFSKHQIHTLRPTKDEYEKLVRRLVVAGDDRGLAQLLSSPILDIIKIDIYAKNEKGQNTIGLINSYRDKYPRLSENYRLCEELLYNYKEPPPSAEEGASCIVS